MQCVQPTILFIIARAYVQWLRFFCNSIDKTKKFQHEKQIIQNSQPNLFMAIFDASLFAQFVQFLNWFLKMRID